MPPAGVFAALCIKRTNKGESLPVLFCYPATMQDRTIDNALLALRKQGGQQGKLADVLLDMRGVSVPTHYQVEPMRRSETARLLIEKLGKGPHSTSQLAEAVHKLRPSITRRAAYNRAYQALLRLEERGAVKRLDGVWLARRASQLG